MNNQTRTWKLSRYTSVVKLPEGGLLLHNAFMGAVVKIDAPLSGTVIRLLRERDTENEIHGPSQYRPTLSDASTDPLAIETEDAMLSLLFKGGFLIPPHLDEHTLVSDVLNKERDLGFHLILLPHENCNFRCTYCYETFERGMMKRPVVAGLKALVENKSRETASLSTSWFGGEPLLARHLIYELSDAFLESCIRHGTRYMSSITTNGYLLSPDVARALLEREVRHYQITLDGPERTHDTTRKLAGGGKTYRKIIENLFLMHQMDDDFSVRLRVNFSNANYPFLDELVDELSPLLEADSRFYIAFHPVGKWGGPNDDLLDICDATSAETVKLGYLEKTLSLGSTARVVRESLMPHGKVCYAGRDSSVVVGSDGRLYKCTVAFEDPRNHVGWLTPSGALQIDQARWDLWTKLDDKNANKCTTCTFHPSCQSRSCPLVAIDRQEPPCPMTSTEYESMIQLTLYAAPSPAETACDTY